MPNIFIEMLEGRSTEQKQELVEGITEITAKVLKVDPGTVFIRFLNVKPEDWAREGKLFINR